MNLSADFTAQTRSLLENNDYDQLLFSLREVPPVALRLNPFKGAFYQRASSSGLLSDKVLWCDDGYYLKERLTFTFDPLFHAGGYYVQEASSMFLEQVIKQHIDRPVVALDLCAAPGGKSTHLRSVLPADSLLVANEVIRNRSQILAENLTKWGHPDVVVTHNDPADFSALPSFFDLIVADVPCSGEGMFRKDPGAIEEWSPAHVEMCCQRQRRIIADVWPALKPGGMLVYSTCTYNAKENEENIAWIRSEFGADVLSVDVPAEWRITGNLFSDAFPVYRFLPYKTRGEGFFLAILRKPDEEADASYHLRSKSKKIRIDFPKHWLAAPNDFELSVVGNQVSAVRSSQAASVEALKQKLRMVQCGVALGEMKGKDMIPAHALAVSKELAPGAFPTQELAYEQAIAYLRREAIVLPPDTGKGYVLLTYKDLPLGFVKNIGNRSNNLYPSEWRIRSGYMPEEVKLLEQFK